MLYEYICNLWVLYLVIIMWGILGHWYFWYENIPRSRKSVALFMLISGPIIWICLLYVLIIETISKLYNRWDKNEH